MKKYNTISHFEQPYKVPSNWQWIKLGNVVSIKGGGTPKKNEDTYWGGNIPWASVKDFKSYYINETIDSITPAGVENSATNVISEGNIIIATRINVGNVAINKVKTAINQDLKALFLNDDSDKYFSLYFLIHNKLYINSLGTGTTVKGITLDTLKNIPFSLPPLPEQREIGALLRALDDKIENNRKTAATLEEMARALYRSWFVDFDPVHARAEGRAPAHMDAATAALFPDRFGEDGLPERWENISLGAAIDQIKITIKPQNKPKEKFLHFSLPAFDDRRSPTTQAGNEIKSNKYLIHNNSILFSKLNPHTQRVWWARTNSDSPTPIASTEFIVCKPHATYEIPWLFSLFSSKSFQEIAISHVTGTSNSHQRISTKAFLNISILKPRDVILKAFYEITNCWFQTSYKLSQQSQTLATLRDTLLPRLMSGELRVSAAKEMVEEASS